MRPVEDVLFPSQPDFSEDVHMNTPIRAPYSARAVVHSLPVRPTAGARRKFMDPLADLADSDESEEGSGSEDEGEAGGSGGQGAAGSEGPAVKRQKQQAIDFETLRAHGYKEGPSVLVSRRTLSKSRAQSIRRTDLQASQDLHRWVGSSAACPRHSCASVLPICSSFQTRKMTTNKIGRGGLPLEGRERGRGCACLASAEPAATKGGWALVRAADVLPKPCWPSASAITHWLLQGI